MSTRAWKYICSCLSDPFLDSFLFHSSGSLLSLNVIVFFYVCALAFKQCSMELWLLQLATSDDASTLQKGCLQVLSMVWHCVLYSEWTPNVDVIDTYNERVLWKSVFMFSIDFLSLMEIIQTLVSECLTLNFAWSLRGHNVLDKSVWNAQKHRNSLYNTLEFLENTLIRIYKQKTAHHLILLAKSTYKFSSVIWSQ